MLIAAPCAEVAGSRFETSISRPTLSVPPRFGSCDCPSPWSPRSPARMSRLPIAAVSDHVFALVMAPLLLAHACRESGFTTRSSAGSAGPKVCLAQGILGRWGHRDEESVELPEVRAGRRRGFAHCARPSTVPHAVIKAELMTTNHLRWKPACEIVPQVALQSQGGTEKPPS